jgi:hypothetical protein
MNFDPVIPTGVAIFMGLLAAAMWGSWFIVLKYLGDYPIEAFYITLFVTSMVLVWSVGYILDGPALLQNIRDVWAEDASRVYVTFICGMLYVVGMQISLRVVRVIGLAITSPIQSSINVIAGTAVSAVVGGIPQGMTVTQITLAAVFLLAAIYLTMLAGQIRNKAQNIADVDTGLSREPKVMLRSILLLGLSSVFIPAYSFAISYGLESITQPNGMAVMPFMVTLCTGAFVGSLLICAPILTIRRQWGVFLQYGFDKHKLGIIAGLAHYGGNIIHTFATRNLSSVVSWPLGITGGLWTQMWGLAYGEFKGSPRIAYVLLVAGLLSYLAGVFIISSPY